MKFIKFEGTVEELHAAYDLLTDSVAENKNKTSLTTQIPLADLEETDELTKEAVVQFLTRRPLTKIQTAVLKTIFNAEDDVGVKSSELAKLIKCPIASVKGSMRSFGKRVAHTKGWPTDLEAFNRKWLGSENAYRLHPAVRAALKSGCVTL